MHYEHCVVKLVGIFEELEVEEGEWRSGVPAVVGVERAGGYPRGVL